jgi:hypothetical protein
MPEQTELMPAINMLQKKLDDAERHAAGIRDALNLLRKVAGLQPVESGVSGAPSGGITQIKSDTFYGKRQQTAVREYLEMRKLQDLGPAKPREIFEALKAGGVQYEAQDDSVAMVGLRALLRKRTNIFHKMPNGSYGLASWYPHAKANKQTAADADAEDELDQEDEDTASAASEDATDA